MKFEGYRIKTVNICRLEKWLAEVRTQTTAAASEEYHRMLSEEVQHLIDNIAINAVPRPECSILTAATEMLNERIRNAEGINAPIEYNLSSAVSMFPEKDYIYILLEAHNEVIREAFASNPVVEDYSFKLDEPKDDIPTERMKKWEAIRQRDSAILRAILTTPLQLNKSLLHFDDKNIRATEIARQNLTNRYVNLYAGGKQLPPEKQMLIIEQAFLRACSPDADYEIAQMRERLMQILPDITLELIEPETAAPEQAEESAE